MLTNQPTVSVLALVPLEKMADYLGEELAMYCGHAIGDFIVISLHKSVAIHHPIIPCLTSNI